DATVDPADFDRFLSLASPPGWEGNPIIFQTTEQRERALREPERVRMVKSELLSTRESRVRPGRDDKILADWNGLAIVALAECGRGLDRPDWIEAAQAAFAHILAARAQDRL